jgi:hypothetical protein
MTRAFGLAGLGATALDVRPSWAGIVDPLERLTAGRLRPAVRVDVGLASAHLAGSPRSIGRRTARARLPDARAVAVTGRMHRVGREAFAPLTITLAVGARAWTRGGATTAASASTGRAGVAAGAGQLNAQIRCADESGVARSVGVTRRAFGAHASCSARSGSTARALASRSGPTGPATRAASPLAPGSARAASAHSTARALAPSSSVGQKNAPVRCTGEPFVAGAVVVTSRSLGSGFGFFFSAATDDGRRAARQEHRRPTAHKNLRDPHLAEGPRSAWLFKLRTSSAKCGLTRGGPHALPQRWS